MAAKPSSSFAFCLFFLVSSARAQRPAQEALNALGGVPLLGLAGANLGRFFDAASRTRLEPFATDIPTVAPAAFKRTFNRLMNRRESHGYDPLIRAYAAKKELDPRLVKSVIAAESEFTARAKSPAGAVGLMQVMPETAGVPRKILLDPEANIRAGTAYLAYLFERAWKRYHLQGVAYSLAPVWLLQRIVAAYNAGPRFLARRRLYRQTREYVQRVLLFYRSELTELRVEA